VSSTVSSLSRTGRVNLADQSDIENHHGVPALEHANAFGGFNMPNGLKKRGQPDRSKVAMGEKHQAHYWTKHLGVSKKELQTAVDKVGNSGAAVRKQLGKS
jgi:Protein of unknown function (DUF3606)